MKKILSTLLIVTLLGSMMFTLTGCWGKDDESEGSKTNVLGQNNNDDENTTVNGTEDEKLEIKSTEDSIVLTDDTGTTMTLLFDENDKVKSLVMSANVETDEEAEFLRQLYSSEEFTDVCTVKVEDKLVSIEYTEEYINLMFGEETRETIEADLLAEYDK